jgi:uncharacterized membrane protein YccC
LSVCFAFSLIFVLVFFPTPLLQISLLASIVAALYAALSASVNDLLKAAA